MPSVTFEVPWVRGKQRPRFNRRKALEMVRHPEKGNHKLSYTPKRTMDDQTAIAEAYEAACRDKYGLVLMVPEKPEKGVVPSSCKARVRIETWRKLPKSALKAARLNGEPDVFGGRDKSDLDNTVKLVLDGLNEVAWPDDCYVTEIVAVRNDRTVRDSDLTRVTVSWGEEPEGMKE